MTQFGYTLSSEEFGPRELVIAAGRAEDAGFDFVSISDHFHPWIQAQGHSSFVWSVVGAIASVTESIGVGIGVSCPLVRIHPAIVAQASATTSLLLGDRFVLGVGTGEALNEHIVGHRWPPPQIRLAMLQEAVMILRALWTGETVDHRGTFYEVENARLFDAPACDIPVVVSGFGGDAVEVASRIGDGYWGHAPDRGPIDEYRELGGAGPTYAQIHVCVGDDEERCRGIVAEQWPNAAIPGQLGQDLPTWTHFEQAASLVTPERLAQRVHCGPDLDSLAELVGQYVDAGFDHIYFHQIGHDQDAFFEAWEHGLRSAIRAGS